MCVSLTSSGDVTSESNWPDEKSEMLTEAYCQKQITTLKGNF